MVAECGQWAGKKTVKRLHRSEKAGMLRDPWLRSAGRHGDADAESSLQYKPWSKCSLKRRAAMINDLEIALGQSSWNVAAPEAPESELRPPSKRLRDDLAGAACTKENEHRRRPGLEEMRETASHRPHIGHAIQRREVGEGAVKCFLTGREMTGREVFHFFRCRNFCLRSKWGQFGPRLRNHRRRGVREKNFKTQRSEKCRVLSSATSQFEDSTSGGKRAQKRAANQAALDGHALPGAEARIEVRSDGIECEPGCCRRHHDAIPSRLRCQRRRSHT